MRHVIGIIILKSFLAHGVFVPAGGVFVGLGVEDGVEVGESVAVDDGTGVLLSVGVEEGVSVWVGILVKVGVAEGASVGAFP